MFHILLSINWCNFFESEVATRQITGPLPTAEALINGVPAPPLFLLCSNLTFLVSAAPPPSPFVVGTSSRTPWVSSGSLPESAAPVDSGQDPPPSRSPKASTLPVSPLSSPVCPLPYQTLRNFSPVSDSSFTDFVKKWMYLWARVSVFQSRGK